jgi:hypothetical protein
MLSALRRAWKKYLESIPAADEPELVPDGKIIREDFRPPPVDPEVKAAFGKLAKVLTSHLLQEAAIREERRFAAMLKPGVEPVEAIARWITKVSTPESGVGGFIALDWKAREEVQWQAEKLLKAHHLSLTWTYSVEEDEEWKTWKERGEAPVKAPLRLFSNLLRTHGYTLFSFDCDDLVCAFAVPVSLQQQVASLCSSADIEAHSEA